MITTNAINQRVR